MRRTDGFTSWARDLTPALFARARHLTGDFHTAQDLVQDTLTQVYIHWDRIQDNNDAYAMRVLFHQFVSRRRPRSSKELGGDHLPDLLAPEADAASRLDLAAALKKLSPAERAVVVARYVEDLPVAEVASLLERSESWVRTTAARTLTSSTWRRAWRCWMSRCRASWRCSPSERTISPGRTSP